MVKYIKQFTNLKFLKPDRGSGVVIVTTESYVDKKERDSTKF